MGEHCTHASNALYFPGGVKSLSTSALYMALVHITQKWHLVVVTGNTDDGSPDSVIPLSLVVKPLQTIDSVKSVQYLIKIREMISLKKGDNSSIIRSSVINPVLLFLDVIQGTAKMGFDIG